MIVVDGWVGADGWVGMGGGGMVGCGVSVLFVLLIYRGGLTGSMHGPTGERVMMGDDFWKTSMPMLAALLFVLYFLIYVGVTLFGASMALQRIALQRCLESFDVRVAGCYAATDRDEIYAAIGAIYLRGGTDGLDAFNHMVRTQLKEQVVRGPVVGGCCLPTVCLSLLVDDWLLHARQAGQAMVNNM